MNTITISKENPVSRADRSLRTTPYQAWVAKAPKQPLVLEPIPVAAFSLIAQQRSVSGSPAGSPVAIETTIDFAARHNISPQTEHFPMSKINEAFAQLESGKARYRIVLDADF